MNGGVERDRGIAHELTRFLIRDNPDGARPTITDRLRAAALRDPWGETDTISSLVYAIVSGDWGAAVLGAAVLLLRAPSCPAPIRCAALHPRSSVTSRSKPIEYERPADEYRPGL